MKKGKRKIPFEKYRLCFKVLRAAQPMRKHVQLQPSMSFNGG
jgi:hypothetical protein